MIAAEQDQRLLNWTNLSDEVWGLYSDEEAFKLFLRAKIEGMAFSSSGD